MRKYLKLPVLIFFIFIFSFTYLPSTTFAHNETSSKKEVKRNKPESQETNYSIVTEEGPIQQKSASVSINAASAPENLITNPSVETTSSSGLPQNWLKGGYGNNTRNLTYPVPGYNSPKAIELSISNYVSGDAKWYFPNIPINSGDTYEFSDYYKSNVQSIITVQYQMQDGGFTYKDIAFLPASSSYKSESAQFTPPSGAVAVTIFHLINSNGVLTTDEFSLIKVGSTPPPPPPTPGNLIQNSNFEDIGSNGDPSNWKRGGWGSNSRVFSYPVNGGDGSRAAKVQIASHSSGDAKWYFNAIPAQYAIYTYSTDYQSNIGSVITAAMELQNGTTVYKDIAFLPPSSNFQNVSVDFVTTASIKGITIFHLIKSVGFITIDNTSLIKKSVPQGIFQTGAVTLSFDDNWLSQYQNALPKLTSSGIKATFYIISQRMQENGFPGFMSTAQIKDLYSKGHEIGAHTRTHPHLSQLSTSEQQSEIDGSRQDLLAMNVGPINTFAYPFGDYDQSTISIIKNAGFESARSTIGGHATALSSKFELPRFSVEVNTTFNQVKNEIDKALSEKDWLILTFHQVNNGADQYTVSLETFNQIVDYIVSSDIPTVTVSEGLASMP